MNKILFTKVWYCGKVLFYADFEDDDYIQVEVEAFSAADNFDCNAKFLISDKAGLYGFVNALREYNVELKKNYQSNNYLKGMPESNLLIVFGTTKTISSHWTEDCEPTKEIEPIMNAIIRVCPELKKII